MKTTITAIAALLLSHFALAQAAGTTGSGELTQEQQLAKDLEEQQKAQEAMRKAIADAERDGISVRMKDIGRFRGIRTNQLQGFGVVVGLAGTGDSQQTPFAATLIQNALNRWGASVGAASFKPKNVAVVMVTAELPPFAAPGNTIDVTVSSFGDAKSLFGGTLLMTPLYGPTDFNTVIAVAQGNMGIGGFGASGSGSSSQKNHLNVGTIQNGGIVEHGVDTQVVFEGNKLFFELYDADLTTAQRVATALKKELPNFAIKPIDGGTIEIQINDAESAMLTMSQIEQTTVKADVPAVVIVNERTGTVVIGGNVRLGPAVVAYGSLQVRIDQIPIIVPGVPFNPNPPVVTNQAYVDTGEDKTQIGVIPPNATISDLAKILQTLQISARDIIAILQALADQGALKAKIIQK